MASVSGRVSENAYDGWRKLSKDTGASVQVLLEFIGENIDTVVDRNRLADLLLAAKEETADRRRHGGPKRKSG